MQCEICVREPGSHSFNKLCIIENTTYFYSCPNDAKKYDDVSGILMHYENMLCSRETENWVYVLDCSGFGLKHMVTYQVGIALVELFSKYERFLQKIYIINPNVYIYTMVSMIWPLLNRNMRERIVYDDKNAFFMQKNSRNNI